ncbi:MULTISPECIES: hypothetical protein [unclassified Rhizobacter]|nr:MULTISPECIES: hypothetical protein [unclassified Rhizobacter]
MIDIDIKGKRHVLHSQLLALGYVDAEDCVSFPEIADPKPVDSMHD